jgi:hypothetical protein
LSDDEAENNIVEKNKKKINNFAKKDQISIENNSVLENGKNNIKDIETKKRKKTNKSKFRIIHDDSSNSNDTSSTANIKSSIIFNEIVNSNGNENKSQENISTNIIYNNIIAKINLDNNDESSEESSNDDDIPLNIKISKPKRQKLILSDDDE